MRVKVSLNKVGLVVPISNANEKVDQLLKTITERFEGHGIEPGQLRIGELQTEDGFLIATNDKISDVIGDGDRLIALNYKDWLTKHAALCNAQWINVISEDFVDDVEKWVSAGLHEYNKLYIKFGTHYPTSKSAQLKRLELFDLAALKDFAKEGKTLVGSISGDDNKWTAEAYFHIKNGTAHELELSVKAESDQRPIIKKIALKLGRVIDKEGEPILVQSNVSEFDPSKFTIPKGIKTGPSFPEELPAPPQPTIDIANNSAQTEFFSVKQKGKVQAEQGWYDDKSGCFSNFFISTFLINNRTDGKIAVANIKSEYQDSKGEWITLPTMIGYNNWNWREAAQFTLESLQQDEVQTRFRIPIHSLQWDKEYRAHSSLPQPLLIRTTFEDSKGGSAVILTQQINGPLSLISRSERQERSGESSIVFWVTCDDTELQTRLYGSVAIPKDNSRVEVSIDTNTTQYLYANGLRKIGYEALKEKREETPLSDLVLERAGTTRKVSALTDLASGFVYALKFEFITNSSKVTEYYPIPKLNLRQ